MLSASSGKGALHGHSTSELHINTYEWCGYYYLFIAEE